MRFGWRATVRSLAAVAGAALTAAAALAWTVRVIIDTEDDWTEAPDGGLYGHGR